MILDNGIGVSVGGSSVPAGYMLDVIGNQRISGNIEPDVNNLYDL